MGRPKKKEETEQTVVVLPPPEDADVGRILTELGASGKYISLRRMNQGSKEFEYVGKYDLAEFDDMSLFQERVKEDHGGGKYQGRIYGDKNGGGVIEYMKYVTFAIDARFRPAVVPPPTLPGATGTTPSELREIQQSLAALAQAITAIMHKPQHDPLDIGLRIAEAMRGGQRDALPISPQPAFAEMFSIFKQGMELGQAANSDGGLGYLPVVEKLGGPLVELLGKMTNRPNPVVEKANGGKPLPRPIPTTPEQHLTASLPQLIGLAAAKKSPELYAELVLDRTPEPHLDFVYTVASRVDVIPYLTSLHPGVKEHEAWFLEFASSIKDQLTPEQEETPETEEVLPEIHDDPQAE